MVNMCLALLSDIHANKDEYSQELNGSYFKSKFEVVSKNNFFGLNETLVIFI